MDPDKIKAALEAIKNGDSEAALALLEELIASAAGADDGGDESDDGGEEAFTEEPEKSEDAAMRALLTLTGAASAGEAAEQYRHMRDQVERLAAREAALDLSSRRELVSRLVAIGVETPSTAWSGDPAARVPCERLSAEPIDALRERVRILTAARPAPLPTPPPAPGAETLSARERAECKRRGIDPADFAARKAVAVRRIK